MRPLGPAGCGAAGFRRASAELSLGRTASAAIVWTESARRAAPSEYRQDHAAELARASGHRDVVLLAAHLGRFSVVPEVGGVFL